jgi:hypothetical protein
MSDVGECQQGNKSTKAEMRFGKVSEVQLVMAVECFEVVDTGTRSEHQ